MRVRDKRTLCQPSIAQLIMRGARSCGFKEPAGCLADLCLAPDDELTGIFVGMIADEPKVVTVGFLPHNHFWLAPGVGIAYAEKAPKPLVRMVAARLRDWLTRAGYNEVMVANLLHIDRSYMRGLAHFGTPSRAGSVIRFTW